MPDKSIGWRKKIHSKPKDVKTGNTTSSRPETPVRVGTPTLTVDTEETRSEASEPSTPRRPPTLARLVSGYRTLKDTSKETDFAEPWSGDAPPFQRPSADPLVSMQSIHTHMNALPTRPIPVDCNSALFHIFEDYRKVRAEKDGLEKLLQETFESLRKAEEAVVETEHQYQAEVRRLEVLMVRGSVSSIAGLMKVRQNSVVKRKQMHRKSGSKDRLQTTLEEVPLSELDEQIKLKSQKVLLQRPTSPSGKMAALSRQFPPTGSADDLHIGTPPNQDTRVFLSRKVKSELDLSSIGAMATSGSITQSPESEFSPNGDPLPDEIPHLPALLNPGIECDALIALQELGTLVARKKGINTNQFVDGLMQLLSMAERTVEDDKATDLSSHHGRVTITDLSEDDGEVDQMLIPKHGLRHSGSQPQLAPEQRRRRHFSFEPGDDDMKKLESVVALSSSTQHNYPKDATESDSSHQRPAPASLESQISNDFQKPSKIPSPIQRPALGSMRRESSLHSVQQDDCRTRASSVLTAHRQNSTGSIPQGSQSRNNSVGAKAAARAARSSGMVRPENEIPFEPSKDHA